MPTAARLSAAIAFAILGFFIYRAMVPSFGDDVIPSYLFMLCILTGVWAGWVLCGKHAHGVMSGLGTGFTAMVAQAFWILIIMSFFNMLGLALRNRYDGPVDAVVDVFAIAWESVLQFATPLMMTTLLVGAVVSGVFAGVMGKKFPR